MNHWTWWWSQGPLNFQLVSEVRAVFGTSLTPATGHLLALGTKLKHFIMALGVLHSSPYLLVNLILYYSLPHSLLTTTLSLYSFLKCGLNIFACTVSSIATLWLQILTGSIILLRSQLNVVSSKKPFLITHTKVLHLPIAPGIYYFWHDLTCLFDYLFIICLPYGKKNLVCFVVAVSKCLEQRNM